MPRAARCQLAIERGLLMRVLAVAQVLDLVEDQRQRASGSAPSELACCASSQLGTASCRNAQCARRPSRRAASACSATLRRSSLTVRPASAAIVRKDPPPPRRIHGSWRRARFIAGPPMSMFSTACSYIQPRLAQPSPRTDRGTPRAGRWARCRAGPSPRHPCRDGRGGPP